MSRWLTLLLALVSACSAQVRFDQVKQEIIESRLGKASTKNHDRMAAIAEMFKDAGCDPTEQKVKSSKEPNVICVMPGKTERQIVVGAHFDQVDEGKGIIDNWSGASLLPSFYQSLKSQPREFTFVFIAFTDEEKEMVGSKFYVKQLSKEQLKNIVAMVNMDTLGLGPTEIWVSHADKKLVGLAATIAKGMSLPVSRMDVDGVGSTDSESFAEKKVPAITFHSLTPDTLKVLHSKADTREALKFEDYYSSYRLIAGYLAYIDLYLAHESDSAAK
jgi:Zn-dependent M28 family amino/carboxypeptidase